MSIQKTYRHLFFDLDHTLWDFDTNSKATLERVFEGNRLGELTSVPFHEFHARYSMHNHFYWGQYSKGLIGQEELRWRRMHSTLLEFELDDDRLARHLSHTYLECLPESTLLFPHTREILQYLKDQGYHLHILSNGFEEVQHKKLKFAGIDAYFDKVITSEASTFVKPDKEIFLFALKQSGAGKSESIMIGDNPEVDILGATNAELHSVHVDHLGKPSPVPATYSVRHLRELEEIF